MLKLLFILLLFTWSVNSQEITGYVYHKGNPISNVHVFVKNSTIKTLSDKKGKFTIKAKKEDLIIFSHIGILSKEIKIKNFDTVKINLKTQINTLEEVKIINSNNKVDKPELIQTAFGKINVRGAGYAVHSISKKDIERSTGELPQILVGKIPNYRLTNDGVILRGGFALWDIDGMLFEGLPPYLDPQEIESVHVITSPAGTFYRYGERGRSGVIIVNTIKNNLKTSKNSYPQLNFLKFKRFKIPSKKKFTKSIKEGKNNIDSLRLMAFVYQNKENFKKALNINRFILTNNPNDIKSYRDLSEVLLKMNKKNEAWNVYKVFLKKEENIDNTSFNIIYHDMERLFHSYNLKKTKGSTFESQKKSSKFYEKETRIVFEWTVAKQNLSIEVVNPKNHSINFQLGDNSVKNCSIEEFFIDETLKGNWQLNLSKLNENKLNGLLKVTIYRNWISSDKIIPEVKFFELSKATQIKYKLLNLKYKSP